MSPVFRHGGLRLYLLKLLDEAPRHGYDVIRLLQDKFLGVYSPSPGTIYPRLARLEEEGLVTHETVDGKKIYKITDAGRAELNRRFDDLADLEDELAASVRDIAKEISRDVRETVRNLRDELTFAVREAGRAGRAPGAGPGQSDADARAAADGQADAGAGEPKADQPGGGAGESGGARAGGGGGRATVRGRAPGRRRLPRMTLVLTSANRALEPQLTRLRPRLGRPMLGRARRVSRVSPPARARATTREPTLAARVIIAAGVTGESGQAGPSAPTGVNSPSGRSGRNGASG